MWNKMHPLSTDTLSKYWKELGETKAMTDCDSCQYKTMMTRAGKIMTGMKLNNGGGFNGVLRFINTNGIVLEGTQREDKAFGLTRTINDDHVSVQIVDETAGDDAVKAMIAFDFDFKELKRVDPNNMLVDVTPDTLKK